ncbi:hypothetical protein B0H19DRAFT_1077963 [Mycena capillaripes]|nr:hypothetical protein B0H19DRAFT_1077963 [Mycena capillaripes]
MKFLGLVEVEVEVEKEIVDRSAAPQKLGYKGPDWDVIPQFLFKYFGQNAWRGRGRRPPLCLASEIALLRFLIHGRKLRPLPNETPDLLRTQLPAKGNMSLVWGWLILIIPAGQLNHDIESRHSINNGVRSIKTHRSGGHGAAADKSTGADDGILSTGTVRTCRGRKPKEDVADPSVLVSVAQRGDKIIIILPLAGVSIPAD